MSAVARFSGLKAYTLDSRCRVTVQQSWRPLNGTELVLIISRRSPASPHPFLRVITPEELAAHREAITNSQVMDELQKRSMRRELASRCWEAHLTDTGKLQLPQLLCKQLDLGPDSEIYQLGRDDFFEIHRAADFDYVSHFAKEDTEVVMPENNDVEYV